MEFQVMKSGKNVLNIDIDDDNDKQQKLRIEKGPNWTV